MKQPTWYHQSQDMITLRLYVQPGSKKNEVIGLIEDEIKIKLATSPIEGQANLALIKYLSQLCKVSQSKITLKKGQKSRHKVIEIHSSDSSIKDIFIPRT
ncbi:MAG: DUF167 domain-containing protein [Legionellaceae bacterium]